MLVLRTSWFCTIMPRSFDVSSRLRVIALSTVVAALISFCSKAASLNAALLTTLWTVIFDAPALCLIVSPSLRQSGEAFRSFMQLYRKLDAAPAVTAESALRCEIANGSRVVSLPGTERTVRGYVGAKLIVCDEAARIDDA
jgi:hypothetical protein